MGLFDNFPYTNFHELNLSWIIQALKEIQTTIDQFVAINALKYADPIQWSIVKQYEKNTIVIDPLTGTAYISVQPVPSGVIITNTDYWSVVFDLGSFVVRAAKNFTDKWEDTTALTATFPSSINDWLIWGDTLYNVISPIIAGDQYVEGSNIEHFTLEDYIGHLADLNTTDKSSIVNAINDVLQTFTTRFSNIKIANVVDYGAVGDGVTNDTSAFDAAFTAADVVYVPVGVYVLDPDYVIAAGKSIIGAHKYNSILKLSGTVGLAIDDYCAVKHIKLTGGSNYVVQIKNHNDGTFEDLLIDADSCNYGLSLNTASRVRVNDVTVVNALSDGVSCISATECTLSDIKAYANGRYGFVFLNCSNDELCNSLIYSNANIGCCCVNSNDLILSGNRYFNNGYHGVQFNTCNNCIYSNSVSDGNTKSGFDFYSSHSCKMVGCISINNDTIGLEIDTLSYYNIVSGNCFKKNGTYGVTIYRSPRNTIVGNEFIDNGSSGVGSGLLIHDDNTGLSRENVIISNQFGDDQGADATQEYGVRSEVGTTMNMLIGNNFFSNKIAPVLRYAKSNFKYELFNTGYDPAEQGLSTMTPTAVDPSVITNITGGPFYSVNNGVSESLINTSSMTLTCTGLDLTAYIDTDILDVSAIHGSAPSGVSIATTTIATITDGNGTTNEPVIIQIRPNKHLSIKTYTTHTSITQLILPIFNISFAGSIAV